MANMVILQDKIINSGKSPIYDQDYHTIGHVHYHFFSMRGKVEITDENEQLVSSGGAKLLTLMPKWIIQDHQGNKLGQINRKLSLFKKKYTYQSESGTTYKIEGNIWDRKFKISKNGTVVIDVASISRVISLRPHTFMVEILDDSIDLWEAINLVQGVRVLVKREQESNRNNEV